jgi:hypothetical protein
MRNLKRLLLNSFLLVAVAAAGWAADMTGGDYEMTKDVMGVCGSPYLVSTDYSMAFAWGEPMGGNTSSNQTDLLISGYFGGRFGNAQTFALLSSIVGQAGTKTFFQDQLQVGVPFDAPIQLTFTDQFDSTTVSGSVQVVAVADHLGNSSNVVVPATVAPDSSNPIITVSPQATWTGNTLYDVQITPKLQNLDGVPLDQITHVYFVTKLDHEQDNVVLNPLTALGLPASFGNGSAQIMSIHIPAKSLSDFSVVLTSRDPLNAPLRVNPRLIQEANDKALSAGGPYQVPLAIQEINAYNVNGDLMGPLSLPAELTINYGGALGAPAAGGGLIRPQTLSLYVLDETHALWVKIPASQNASVSQTVGAPVTQLSVFALMGSADASTTDSFVFPVPWRPHGPNAGTGAGQTGTEAGGLTFSDLPSECTIKIYTIAGELVRQIQHSDIGGLIGQEPWDAKTTHGENVASGVYLWEVESSVDRKIGKLMIIR